MPDSDDSSSGSEPRVPKPRGGKGKKRTPRRRARLTVAKKQEIALEAQRRKLEARAAADARRNQQIEDAKAAIQQLIDQDAQRKRDALVAKRPASLIEFCRARGIPEDVVYHPRYNVVGVDPSMPLQLLELYCFLKDWPSEYGGLGAYLHLKNFIALTWPHIEWNEWLEACLRSLCDSDNAIRIGNCTMRFVNWVGAGSCGKTFSAGLFAVCWWMTDLVKADPTPHSSVTLTSTTKGIIAERVWPVIQMLFHDAKFEDGSKWTWGRMIDSMKKVEPLPPPDDPKRRDGKHIITALAVETGELQKSLDNIKGRHTKRMLLIVDEANTTPQAIFECIPNMLTSAREIIVLVIGNAGSHLDPHGLACEPATGWKSVKIDDTEWRTKGIAKWGIGPGVCLHFDGAKSPNVLAGRTVHPHIYSFERWQQVLRAPEEYRNTLQHWSQDRGFWPPDGLSTTIFSEAMVLSHDGMGKFSWLTRPVPCASLDPAHGGDQCVLVRGALGDIIGARKGIQVVSRHVVPFDPDSPDDIQAQIARYVIAKCKEWGVEPPLFGTDSTGTGRGVAGFIKQFWSPHIVCVEFGGAASDLPASTDDPRESHEIYANRVTELWYACRNMLDCSQIKGLYAEAINDFCSRTYKFVGRRYQVERKDEMKLRLSRSPDDGDAVAILVDVARNNGLTPKPYVAHRLDMHALDGALDGTDMDDPVASGYTESNTYDYAPVD